MSYRIANQLTETLARTIYGSDDRVEAHRAPRRWQELASATAVAMHRATLPATFTATESVEIPGVSAGMRYGLCPGERFADQRAPGICSGFLVAPDLLVTAGHCLSAAEECGNEVWVFGYSADATGVVPASLPGANFRTCRRVVRFDAKKDFALVQLDRPLADVRPLPVRRSGELSAWTPVGIIGNPLGLPTKVALGGIVRESAPGPHFIASLDSFVNNSGSAVINSTSLLVEGILIAGEQDLQYDPVAGCERTKVCEDFGCAGEAVTRITEIFELREGPTALAAARAGDAALVEHYLAQGGWPDLADEKQSTLLHEALKSGDIRTVTALIAAGADPERTNLAGVSPRQLAQSDPAIAVMLLPLLGSK